MLDKIPEAVVKDISSSTLSSYLKVVSYGTLKENNKDVRYVDLEYHWTWNRVPFFTLSDMVAVAFGSNTSYKYAYKKVSNYRVTAPLSPVVSGVSLINQNIDWNYDTNKKDAIFAKFALALKGDNSRLEHFCWGGSGKFRLTNVNFNSRLYIDAAYGHTTIQFSPSFSVNISGISGGINFGFGMDEQHCTGLFYENFKIDNSYIYHGTIYGK